MPMVSRVATSANGRFRPLPEPPWGLLRRDPVAGRTREAYIPLMRLSRQRMMELMKARDETYDGRFITGVLSTGIYCLPSCKARKPKPENVRFFEGPEKARRAGLRACKRCRPDDFYAREDPDRASLLTLIGRLRRTPQEFPNVEALVEACGCGASKLHGLVRAHFHTTPGSLLQEARIAAAAQMLVESQRPVSAIAFDVGYESLSAFGENFRRRMALSPGEYRKLRGTRRFRLALPRAFPVEAILKYLGRDPDSLTDRVEGSVHESGFWLGKKPARLRLELRGSGTEAEFSCLLSGEGLEETAAVKAHAYALRRLGFHWRSESFERQVVQREDLRPLVSGQEGLRVPLTGTPFDAVTWAILGQQINLPFAFRLQGRLAALAGAPAGNGLWAPPTSAAVAALDPEALLRRQFSKRKVEYLIGVAEAVESGALDLAALGRGSALVVEDALLALRGIGPWTARYILMRGYGFHDCVPVGDAGLVKGLQSFFDLPERPDARKTEELMAPFRPYRSLATFHFWKSLEVAA